MPEYAEEQTELTKGNQQPKQHPSQPLEVQPDGTWILGRGADRWIPSKNQMGDLRWLVERDLRRELGVPPATALNKDKIEFHKRQLALLDLAKQAPRCEHVFTDGRCCKAPRVKKGTLCYAHTLMEEKRPQEWNLPPLEDANAVMLWLMDVLKGLMEGRISEKTAGLMFYGLQLAMVNARDTTFSETNHAEMVRKAPRDRRERRHRASSPTSEGRALPQTAQRNTEEGFTAKGAEAAKKEEQRAFTAKVAEVAKEETAEEFTAEVAENAEQRAFTAGVAENAEEAGQDKGNAQQVEGSLELQNAGGIPGVESAKSIFFGVEPGEGVADNRPVSPPPEPPRKSSQSEILVIPKEVEHHLRR
jgi:hypothetical protein